MSMMTVGGDHLSRDTVPRTSLVGLTIIALGVAVDLTVHLAVGADHGPAGFTPSEHAAHFIVLPGMVLTLAGIVIDGARHQAQRSHQEPANEPTSERNISNAVR